MPSLKPELSSEFRALLDEIPQIGLKEYATQLFEHAEANRPHISRTLRDLPPLTGAKARSGVVISAGPSVHRRRSIQRLVEARYQGAVICVDGSYVACLKAGLIPDFVFTMDPGVKRMVRWFGDPDFEENSRGDDYFDRQDLDVEFRKNSLAQNSANIELVNRHAPATKAVASSVLAGNVTRRIKEAGFDIYWWNPLVDNPHAPDSMTRRLFEINPLPCLNTGGNVGTAAWVFASMYLKLPRLAMVGMDYGYYIDTPLSCTQTYHELVHRNGGEQGLEKFFIQHEYPGTGEKYYTDPVYYWYRDGFLDMARKSKRTTYNCTEGGTLHGENIECVPLDAFLAGENGG